MIVPLVLHHSETGWTGAVEFERLVDLDDETRAVAEPFVPRFRLVLEDVSQLSDDELLGRSITALGRLVLVCFRQARDMRALLGNLKPWAQTMAEVRKAPNGMRAFALVLRYMFETGKDLEPDEVRTLVETADPVPP